jgi:hypothetical protein
MNHSLTYVTSRPRRVAAVPLPTTSVSGEVSADMFSTQIPVAAPFSNPQNPKSHLQTCTTMLFRRFWLRSGLCQPFNAHRGGLVQRFSPIHF